MAVAPVTLPPALSAWNAVGLSHLLLECPVSELQAHVLKGAFSGAAAPAFANELPVPNAPSLKNISRLSGAMAAHSDFQAVAEASPQETASLRSVPFSSAGPRSFLPPERWPESWRKVFSKATPASLLWSYHSLGLDMEGGSDSKQRSALLRRLIGQLNLPKGSSVFWPCAMPAALPSGDTKLAPAPDIFFSGVTLLKPQVLIFFGDQAAEDIEMTSKPACFSQTLVDGKLLLLLPDLDVLHSEASVNSVVSFMRAALAAIPFNGS